ncbi:hypothetical protein HIM_00891 [Hirsutella minnesotensis 3608]|nr:hypothetical protein HIM_00891 [Hirsutella minnesotensis 3608]
MSEPLLAINGSNTCDRPSTVPNLLPCRIHHNGSVNPSAAFWMPTQAEDSNSAAYFRGRKLQAQALAVPVNYQGVLVERMPQEVNERSTGHQASREQDDDSVQVETMQVTGQFEKVLVWSHGASSDSSSDAFIRGINEWLQVADKIHSFTDCEKASTNHG